MSEKILDPCPISELCSPALARVSQDLGEVRKGRHEPPGTFYSSPSSTANSSTYPGSSASGWLPPYPLALDAHGLVSEPRFPVYKGDKPGRAVDHEIKCKYTFGTRQVLGTRLRSQGMVCCGLTSSVASSPAWTQTLPEGVGKKEEEGSQGLLAPQAGRLHCVGLLGMTPSQGSPLSSATFVSLSLGFGILLLGALHLLPHRDPCQPETPVSWWREGS